MGGNPPYKWMGFGDKETHPVYKGQVKNGKSDGLGIINYLDKKSMKENIRIIKDGMEKFMTKMENLYSQSQMEKRKK